MHFGAQGRSCRFSMPACPFLFWSTMWCSEEDICKCIEITVQCRAMGHCLQCPLGARPSGWRRFVLPGFQDFVGLTPTSLSLFVLLWLVVNDRKFSAGTVFFSHTNRPAVLLYEPVNRTCCLSSAFMHLGNNLFLDQGVGYYVGHKAGWSVAMQLGVIMHGYPIALMSSLHSQKSLGGPLERK